MKPSNDTYIFNPDTEDFTTTYDTNGDGQPISYTIHSLEVAKFPDFISNHLAHHLAKQIMFKRGIKLNAELDYEAILREIKEVTL